MVKKIGIFFILVSVLFSCSNNENITLGKVEIVKKVKFEQPIIPMSTVINSGNYIAFDALKRRLVMFNKEGKIIDSYEKHGKGPGEFLREEDLFLMGVHNDKLYVLEYAQNRVVIFNISSNENFKYMDEFVVNNGRVITGGISSNGRIYLNEMIGDNLFKIYNETGKQKNEIIRRNQVDLNQLSAKEMKKYFIENIYIPHFDENNIVLTGVFNKHIKFYKKNKDFSFNDCIAMCSNTTNGTTNTIAQKYAPSKMSKSTGHQNIKEVFEEGTWVGKDFKLAQTNADKIRLIKPYYNNYNRSSFVGTMLSLFTNDDFDFNEFMHKLRLQPTSLVDCTNRGQYKTLIEDIYNYRSRNKVNLRY